MLRSTLTAAGTWLRPAPLMRSRSALGEVLLAIAPLPASSGLSPPPLRTQPPLIPQNPLSGCRPKRSTATSSLSAARFSSRTAGRRPAGATVGVFGPTILLEIPKRPLVTTKSEPNGSFEITYSRLPFASGYGGNWRMATIAASLPGFGFQWTHWFFIDPAKTPVLKLVHDVPIRGRVLNLEGKPVSGIRVRVLPSIRRGNETSTQDSRRGTIPVAFPVSAILRTTSLGIRPTGIRKARPMPMDALR